MKKVINSIFSLFNKPPRVTETVVLKTKLHLGTFEIKSSGGKVKMSKLTEHLLVDVRNDLLQRFLPDGTTFSKALSKEESELFKKRVAELFRNN